MDLPFVVCQLRVKKLSILVATFYARPGEGHQDRLTQGLHALGTFDLAAPFTFRVVGDFNTVPQNIQPEILTSLKATHKIPNKQHVHVEKRGQ